MTKTNINPKIAFLTLGIFLLNIACSQYPAVSGTQDKCLPNNIKLTDIVSADLINSNTVKKVTVGQKLNQLKAYCNRKAKLVDKSGKEIYFYKLTSCWGNPPANYPELLAKQNQELQKLSATYNVITMTCNPSGFPYP